ncbi:MAG TPA: YebC/PmpR family DNA-binding transcriptional regulator [Lentisphaeria bacterium]|nr:MAG: transcriptional regulator [Lentisphaerae bacterium GWF2_38_69]HBM17000.1 YebC/PmpR family DNA-binding transcriptional regulator [Lentisphaeria bacterium]
MSGHSKWANIKHKKGAADKKKGKIFSRLSKEIIVSAKTGGSDPNTNARLRAAILAAKSANMPVANVERAIKKGSGEDADASSFEEIVYEGYGTDGVAILVECLSDNRNRTSSEVRAVFDKNGGNMGSSGAVSWMFPRKSRFVVTGENASEEKLMDIVIDAGAEDIEVIDGSAEIWAPVEAFDSISKALQSAKITPDESELTRKPENYVQIKDKDKATRIIKLVEKFEELDDVQSVHANFDIPEEILETIQID